MSHALPQFMGVLSPPRQFAFGRFATKMMRSMVLGLPHSIFGGHVTSSVTFLWNQASISNGFQDIQRQLQHNG